MANFIGRDKELAALNLLANKKTASIAVVKGRRRIGKSRLVEEFAKDKHFLKFSGIPPTDNVTAQSQRDVFAKQLSVQLGLPGLNAHDWADLFTLLAKQTTEKQTVILFDEISWMGSHDPTFLGKLKNAWDMEFKQNNQLIIILCGSVSTWIEKNIVKSTAFFGRISLHLTLQDLPLTDSAKLLALQGFKSSPYEMFKVLSVTGGIPWYLEHIQESLSADENIKNLCFKSSGILVKEFDLIFHDLFSKRNAAYKEIVEVLSSGHMELNEIRKEINYPRSGVISTYLENLKEAGFISRDFTWNIKSGEVARLSHFRLSDNYLRFYLKYIVHNLDKISRDELDDISMTSLRNWDIMMGLQFENLVLKNRKLIKERLRLRVEDIVVDNPYFQCKSTHHARCQVDYLIQTRFKVLYVCEIKFSINEIKSDIIKEMQNKVERLKLPHGFACCPILIHVNGVQNSVVDSGYFTEVIDFGEFLKG